MNSAQALHSAARRYCIEKYHSWCEIYAALPKQGRAGDGYHYSPKALDTFPRYNMLDAIRVALESIDSDTLADFEAAKSLVIGAGWSADDDFTRNSLDETAANAQSNEREKFCEFVSSLTEPDVWNYDPLPYRRVLSDEESEQVWSEVRAAWGDPAHLFWSPPPEMPISTFKAGAFDQFVPTHALRRKLAGLSVQRVWELREFGPSYVEEVEIFEPIYNGAEGVWSSPGFTWVIYASHESTVAVAGTLLPEIKRMWPDWQQFQW